MKYFRIMLFVGVMVCWIFATVEFVHWMFLVSLDRPIIGTLLAVAATGFLSLFSLFLWMIFFGGRETYETNPPS